MVLAEVIKPVTLSSSSPLKNGTLANRLSNTTGWVANVLKIGTGGVPVEVALVVVLTK